MSRNQSGRAANCVCSNAPERLRTKDKLTKQKQRVRGHNEFSDMKKKQPYPVHGLVDVMYIYKVPSKHRIQMLEPRAGQSAISPDAAPIEIKVCEKFKDKDNN